MRTKNWMNAAGLLAISTLLLAGGCKEDASEPMAETPEAPAAAEATAEMQNPDAPVVTVNEEVLTQGELQDQVQRLLAAQRMQNVPEEQMAQAASQMRQRVVDAFVAQTVLIDEAERQGISTSESDVEEAMNNIKDSVPEGMTFEQILETQGLTEERVREDVERGMKMEKLLDQQTNQNAVTEADVKDFYDTQASYFEQPEMVTARHILLSVEEDADEATKAEKKAKAEEIHKQLVEGADFAELAEAHSDCPSKARGGNLGSFPRGRMVKEFEDAAFTQNIGEIGPVIETQFGYHIVEVLEKQEAGKQSLDEARPMITDFLEKQKKQETMASYVKGLIERADVTYGDAAAE